MSEFRIGKIDKGLRKSIGAIILFGVVPFVLIYVIGMISEGTFRMPGLVDLMWGFIMFCPILAVFAFPVGYYAKGNKGRVLFSLVYTLVFIVILLYVTNFGEIDSLLVIEQDGSHGEIDITITGLLVLLIVFRLLKQVVVYFDHRDHRSEFLKDNGLDGSGNKSNEDDSEEVIRVRGRYD